MTITHANVQNLRVVQGPLQRYFGIASLEVDTAGGGSAAKQARHQMGSGHTVRIAGIEKLDVKIENGKIPQFRARMALSFKYEG